VRMQKLPMAFIKCKIYLFTLISNLKFVLYFRSNILLTINGIVALDQQGTLIQNQFLAINETIYFGQGLSSSVFSGWFTDINVWSRPLSTAEVTNFSICGDIFPGPDVVDWFSKDLNITVGKKVERFTSKRKELCFSNDEASFISLYIFTNLKSYVEARLDCRSLGGKMPIPQNEDHLKELMESSKNDPEHKNCHEGYWIPMIQSKYNFTKWIVDDGSEREATYQPWSVGQPNGGQKQNCTKTFSDRIFEYLDNECDYDLCTLCMLSTKSFLHLRGMCKYDNLIDEDYALRVDLLKKEIYEFQGFTGLSKIWWNSTSTRWLLILSLYQPPRIIGSTIKTTGFPTGLTEWSIDESICKSDNPSKPTFLKLTKVRKKSEKAI